MKYAEDIVIPTKVGSLRITQEQYGTGFVVVKLYEKIHDSEFISLSLSVPYSSISSSIEEFKRIAYLIADRRPIELGHIRNEI